MAHCTVWFPLLSSLLLSVVLLSLWLTRTPQDEELNLGELSSPTVPHFLIYSSLSYMVPYARWLTTLCGSLFAMARYLKWFTKFYGSPFPYHIRENRGELLPTEVESFQRLGMALRHSPHLLVCGAHFSAIPQSSLPCGLYSHKHSNSYRIPCYI